MERKKAEELKRQQELLQAKVQISQFYFSLRGLVRNSSWIKARKGGQKGHSSVQDVFARDWQIFQVWRKGILKLAWPDLSFYFQRVLTLLSSYRKRASRFWTTKARNSQRPRPRSSRSSTRHRSRTTKSTWRLSRQQQQTKTRTWSNSFIKHLNIWYYNLWFVSIRHRTETVYSTCFAQSIDHHLSNKKIREKFTTRISFPSK